MNLANVGYSTGDFQTGLDHGLAAVDLFRKIGIDFEMAAALGNCGWYSLSLGNPARAEEFFQRVDGRLRSTRSDSPRRRDHAASRGDSGCPARGAAQLLSAAASLREELGVGFFDEEEEALHERAVAGARAALGEEGFAEARARGAGRG